MIAHRADGRWGGRLTSRPLPEGDASVDALPDADRAELAAVWHARSASEARVGEAFAVIRDALTQLRADSALVAVATRATDDEHRHAELCRRLASRFAGRELDAPAPLALVVPAHRGASEVQRLRLWVVGQCCMNETLASAFLEAALLTSTAPLAHAALRELLSDEIDHARLGWAFVATLTPAERAELAPWLLPLLRANLRMWREAPRGYPKTETLATQGAPLESTVEAALRTGIGELILPGLEHLGLPTAEAHAWLDAGAP